MAEPVSPAQGPRPANFNEVQTNAESVIVITCCCVVTLSAFFRALGRFAAYRRNKREDRRARWLGLDDAFNFSAVAIYICILIYNIVLGLTELSVLALYQRIIDLAAPKMLITLNWCIIGLVTTNTCINVFIAAFQCSPIRAAFDSSIPGKCINRDAFYIGNAITNILVYCVVYLLSIFIIKPLRLIRERKRLLLFTMLTGLSAVIVSCIRLAFLPSLLANADVTYAMGTLMDWSVIELTVAILTSSIPAISSIIHLWSAAGEQPQNSHPTPLYHGSSAIRLNSLSRPPSAKTAGHDNGSETGLIP
ncbi:hypothetical protein F5884DRAFT_870363 [Xylogone sp. PMI_703]|nr:hypothetical protein F5884DRAFT_870363 [Xylogone sp. PMI_703]